MRLLRIVLVAAFGVGLVAGCGDREDQAVELDHHLRSMPGVADTDMQYQSDITNGERFGQTVTLDAEITDAQVRAIGTFFVDRAEATGLAEDSAELKLRLAVVPPPPESSYDTGSSETLIQFGRSSTTDNPTAEGTAENLGAWLRAARSPITTGVLLVQPTWDGTGDSRRIEVTLRPGVTQAQALELQAGDPSLADASWGISLAADANRRPHTYYSTPRPPSDVELDTWRQISALVGVDEPATGRTDVPAERGKQAETVVEFSLPYGGGSEVDAPRIAFGVADLLRRFDRPVQVLAHGGGGSAEFIVGGCFRHQSDHVPTALEVDLARQFQRC